VKVCVCEGVCVGGKVCVCACELKLAVSVTPRRCKDFNRGVTQGRCDVCGNKNWAVRKRPYW
jgi:hypothetical protein